MFIDTAKFKKAAKTAYEGPGLDIMHHENGIMQVSGGGWIMTVDTGDITKKCMAALVELAGPLPEVGKGYRYMKNRDRQELGEELPGWDFLLEDFTKGQRLQDTRITVKRYGRNYDIMQRTDTKEPLLVPEEIHVVVNPDKVDREHDELRPEPPVLHGHMVIYNNDTMQFAIMETMVHNSGERDFLRLVNGKDMAWPYED